LAGAGRAFVVVADADPATRIARRVARQFIEAEAVERSSKR
jgi:hypothetical protein